MAGAKIRGAVGPQGPQGPIGDAGGYVNTGGDLFGGGMGMRVAPAVLGSSAISLNALTSTIGTNTAFVSS